MIDFTGRHLYLCTPIRDDLEEFLTSCITGGVDIVQLRQKESDAKHILEAARRARSVCNDLGVPFIMNDRPDLALEVGADGVHVGQDDAPVDLCRRLLGADSIIGLSTHASSELDQAIDEDVTYLSAGPVEATPTKPGRPGTGPAYVIEALRKSPVPVFVTGGVTPESILDLGAIGVRHFVVVRALTEAANPKEMATALRRSIEHVLAH